MDDEPVIVDSGLSQEIEVDGYTFEINIYCGFQNYRTAISLNPGQPFQ